MKTKPLSPFYLYAAVRDHWPLQVWALVRCVGQCQQWAAAQTNWFIPLAFEITFCVKRYMKAFMERHEEMGLESIRFSARSICLLCVMVLCQEEMLLGEPPFCPMCLSWVIINQLLPLLGTNNCIQTSIFTIIRGLGAIPSSLKGLFDICLRI